MQQKTQLSQLITETEYITQYDTAAKRVVSNKQVLARISKETVDEFREYSHEEIMECIEEEVYVSEKGVFPIHVLKKETEGEISDMCNLGLGLAEKYAERGWNQGLERGMAEGISKVFEVLQEVGLGMNEVVTKLVYKVELSEEEVREKVEENWK